LRGILFSPGNVLIPNPKLHTIHASSRALGDCGLGPAASGEREVHRCCLTVGFRLGLIEVGVSIEKKQAVSAAPPKCQQAAKHDRAIATENDGKLTHVNCGSDRICECHRIIGNSLRVENLSFRVAAIVIRRRLNAPGVPRLQAFAKTFCEQSIGQRLHALREESEDRRGFDYSEARNGLFLPLCGAAIIM
jgi:hypothetical protein